MIPWEYMRSLGDHEKPDCYYCKKCIAETVGVYSIGVVRNRPGPHGPADRWDIENDRSALPYVQKLVLFHERCFKIVAGDIYTFGNSHESI
jgi:hypothetical protein